MRGRPRSTNTGVSAAVLAALHHAGDDPAGLSNAELAERTRYAPRTLVRAITALRHSRVVEDAGYGRWRLTAEVGRECAARLVALSHRP